MRHHKKIMSMSFPSLERGIFRRLCVLGLIVLAASCDFSRVEVSCLEHIGEDDMGRFLDQGNGVVLDPQTGVEWYRCPVGQRYTQRGCAGPALLMTWEESGSYLKEISNKAGEAWRLPKASEFVALGEKTCINPALNPNVFPNALVDNHWVFGEGIKEGKACAVYTYKATRSCRLFSENARPFYMVKAK